MTRYLAIFKDDKKTIVIEFTPLLDGPEFEPFFTGIEIESIDIQQLPHTWAEQRAAYIRTPTRRGIVLDEAEEHAEAIQPTARLEARQLGMFEG